MKRKHWVILLLSLVALGVCLYFLNIDNIKLIQSAEQIYKIEKGVK